MTENARQIAFRKIKALFSALIFTVPDRLLTDQEATAAGSILAEKFTEIMDEYDRNKRA